MTIIANGSPAIGRLNDHDLPGVVIGHTYIGEMLTYRLGLPTGSTFDLPADDVQPGPGAKFLELIPKGTPK